MRHPPTSHPTPHPPFPIRPGMDVFSAYQDEYIGSVIEVQRSAAESGGGRSGDETAPEHLAGTPALEHEEGAATSPVDRAGSKMMGEEMGPFPTMSVGNTGPDTQSAAHDYATHPDSTYSGVAWFAVRPGRLNLGPLTPPLYIPVSAVRSLSMERIVLDVQRAAIPSDWRTRP